MCMVGERCLLCLHEGETVRQSAAQHGTAQHRWSIIVLCVLVGANGPCLVVNVSLPENQSYTFHPELTSVQTCPPTLL